MPNYTTNSDDRILQERDDLNDFDKLKNLLKIGLNGRIVDFYWGVQKAREGLKTSTRFFVIVENWNTYNEINRFKTRTI